MRLITVALFILLTQLSSAAHYYLRLNAGSLKNLINWGSNPSGSGPSPTSFTNPGDVWHIGLKTSLVHSNGVWQVPSTSSLVLESNLSFSISLTGRINAQIVLAPNSTLTVMNIQPVNVASATNGTVVYQTNANRIWAGNYGVLIVRSDVSMFGNVSVAGTFSVAPTRTVSLSNFTLALNGTTTPFTGGGTFSTGVNSCLHLAGGNGGNSGSFVFASTPADLKGLVVNYSSPNSFMSLNSALRVTATGTSGTGYFNHQVGGITLNGNSFTTDNGVVVDFPLNRTLGRFLGASATTDILIRGTTIGATGGDSLFIDGGANTLRSLSFGSTGQDMHIALPVNIIDSVSVLAGTMTSNDNITLKASSSMRGRIGRMGASASLTGSLTVETHLHGGSGRSTGWMNLGTPGVDGETVASWDTWYTSSGVTGIPVTCTGCTQGPKNGWFTSIQSYAEPTDTYNDLIVTSPLTEAQGFWVYVGSANYTTTPFTLINNGPAVQGAVTMPLTAGGVGAGWNLVSNPYSSPISWTLLHNLNGGGSGSLGAEISVWSPQNGGQFGTYVAGNVSGTNGQTDVIPAGQGFYVVASAAMTLQFDESVKTNFNTVNHLRTRSGEPSVGEIRLMLESTAGAQDETILRFMKDATAGFDESKDAHKLFLHPELASYTSLSSKDQGGLDYSINSLPLSFLGKRIPLNTRLMNAGAYSISAKDIQDLGNCVVLFDKLENKAHDLRTGSYLFTVDGPSADPRFELMVCENAAVATSVKESDLENHLLIGQDAKGAFVRTSFARSTPATISAFNIVGQQIMKDIAVEGTDTITRLDLNVSNQVIIIRVTTGNETVVKKMIFN